MRIAGTARGRLTRPLLTRPLLACPLLIGASAALAAGLVAPTAAAAPQHVDPFTPLHIRYVSTTEVPTASTVRGVPVGGLSGITYDAHRRQLLAISDDRGERGPARFYTFPVAVALRPGTPFQPQQTDLVGLGKDQSDTESLRLLPSGNLLVSSEADAPSDGSPAAAAFVRQYTRSGRPVRSLALPPEFRADFRSHGFRDNLGFEGMDVRAGTVSLLAESALAQDGPIATTAHGADARLLVRRPDGATTEFVYRTDPVPVGTSGDNGNAELLALNATDYLVIERGYDPTTARNHVRLYWTTTLGALPIGSIPGTGHGALLGPVLPMPKRLVFDFADVAGLTNPDNVEGITFGPRLADGARSLILVSDNNFSARQRTLLHVLAMG